MSSKSAAPTSLSLVAILSPCVACLVALLVHFAIPNRQNLPVIWMDPRPAWQHPYPVLLAILLAASLLLVVAQWRWAFLRPWVRHYSPLLAGAILALGLWDLNTLKLGWMPLPFFPGPDQVLRSTIEDRGLLLESTGYSLLLLLSGYTVGVIAGVVTGVLIGWFPRARYWGMPVLKVVGPVPAPAMIPLVMILSNESFLPATALIGFAVWFPVTMLTSSGIANVPLSYLEVARTLGAGRGYLIFRVAVPAALPSIFVGLFMGLVSSFLALIVAESVGVPVGLGWYLKLQKDSMDYPKMYAAIVVLAAVCSALMTLLFKLRDRVLSWQKGLIRW